MVAPQEETTILPALRQDLQLMKGAADEDGAPRWLLFDGMRNQYFAISREAFDLVRHWQPGLETDCFTGVLAERGFEYSREEVDAFTEFLINNHLVMARDTVLSSRIAQQQSSRKKGLLALADSQLPVYSDSSATPGWLAE